MARDVGNTSGRHRLNSLENTGKKTREFSPNRHQQVPHNRLWQKETGKKGSELIRKDIRFLKTDLAKDIGKHLR